MKFTIITFGCTLNRSESLRMKYLLEESGNKYVDSIDDADIVIINTCTVKTLSENKAYRVLRKLKDKKVIVTGCLVQHRPEKFRGHTIVGNYEIDKICEAVNCVTQGRVCKFLEVKRINKLKIPSSDEYPIKIVPLQEGCLWDCTYCATKLARSLMQSFPPEDVYKEVEEAVGKKLRIIYFTGTDLAVYGFDIGTNLPKLLRGLKNIEGLFFVRVGMANPGILNKFIDNLLEAYKDPRIYKFFHIPVQSGSNKVLSDMKRLYTVEDFIELVEKIRKKYPLATISTDIIVGYPTESEEDFEKTLELLETGYFDVVNISRFWPRPKTEAEKLKQLPSDLIKRRSKKVSEVFREVTSKKNKEWIDWEGWIIIESKGKGDSWVGRTYTYKQTIVKSNKNLLGKFVKVRITDATHLDLRGEILEVKEEIDIEEWTQ